MVNIKKAQWIALIKDTILKESRSKTLLFIFVATNLMIFIAHSILKMFLNNSDVTTGLAINPTTSLSYMFRFINAWNVIIAGIFGISAVASDFREKIIYQYLTFPISRTQYMFGRIFGAWILVYGYYFYAYIISALLFSIATNSFALSWHHLVSMLLMALYIFIVIFISFFYSLFFNKIGSFLLLIASVVMISIANQNFRYLTYADYFKELGLFKLVGGLVYFIFPRINYISEVANSVMFKEEIALNLYKESLHLFITLIIMLFIADRVMKKKNF